MARVDLVSLALALAAGAASPQAVLTVGADGQFATPQAAIDAAAPGDVVLLLDGFIDNVVIDKGVALVGPQGLIKPSSGPGATEPVVRIVGIPSDQAVLLSGLTVFVGDPGADAAVEIQDCAGPVWVQDCFVDSYGAPAMLVHAAASLVLAETAVQTNLMPVLPDGTPQAAPGLRLDGDARAWLHGGFAHGSHGILPVAGGPAATAAPDGGPGLLVLDAQARAAGTQLMGGSGNSFFSGDCAFSGDGGSGLVTQDGAGAGFPAVTLRSCTVTGGGTGFATCPPFPVAGAPFDVLPGTVTQLPGVARALVVTPVVHPGGPVTLSFDGAAGDVALLFGAAGAAPATAIGAVHLHLEPDTLFPVAVFALGSASLDVPATVPPLPAGVDALLVPLQAFFVDAQGGKHASAPRAVLVH